MLARLRLGGEFAQRPRGEPPDRPARASRREFIELDEAHSGWISRSPAAATNTGLSISTSWPDYDRRCGGSRETHCTTACSRLAIGSEGAPSIAIDRAQEATIKSLLARPRPTTSVSNPAPGPRLRAPTR